MYVLIQTIEIQSKGVFHHSCENYDCWFLDVLSQQVCEPGFVGAYNHVVSDWQSGT